MSESEMSFGAVAFWLAIRFRERGDTTVAHVTEVSNDCDTCQMLSAVMDTEIKQVFREVLKLQEVLAFVF